MYNSSRTFVDYNTVDKTKISFSSHQNKNRVIITNVLYEGMPVIFKIPNHRNYPLGVEISPTETNFLELLDYIREQMPRSKQVVNVGNIYIRHPYDINGLVRIKTRGYAINGITIRGYDNGFNLNFGITEV